MTTKKPKLAVVIILSLMVATFIVISCNSDKKETPPENKTDTTHMDTATTRPVKGGD